MEGKTYEYEDDFYKVTATIDRATLRIGQKRTRLLSVRGDVLGDDADEVDFWSYRMFVDIVSATSKLTNNRGGEAKVPWPLTYDQFLDLPEMMVMGWHDAVVEVNPHWVPWRQAGEPDDQGEAEGESPSGSLTNKASSPDA